MKREQKATYSSDEVFQNIQLDLFDVLNALDRKDYGYYDTLTDEQKKQVIPYLLTTWMSVVKAKPTLARYYALSTNEYANKYLFNENIQKHPKLQWLMLCCISPTPSKQYHHWISQLKEKVVKYKEDAHYKETSEFFKKVYPSANEDDIKEISLEYVSEQKRKVILGKLFPTMKLSDIDMLNTFVTDEHIKEYARDHGI